MPGKELYIGLMSGTSADDIDAALLDFSAATPLLLETLSADISDLQQEIFALAQPGENEIHRLNQLDRELGLRFAKTVKQLVKRSNQTANAIRAIGSHGQTIRHLPPSNDTPCHAYSHQIGDPNTIAQLTGITTVADFRRRDIAAGGQGAPLVTTFHREVFQQPGTTRTIVNIGGMSNITYLPGDGTLLGFDTGPGNVLMDGWIKDQLNQPYDEGGKWAGSGEVQPALLEALLKHPFLKLAPPKSTGREAFNLSWLKTLLLSVCAEASAEDIQATLLEFTALTITDAVQQLPLCSQEVYLCGGGARNTALVCRIAALAEGTVTDTTAKLGIDPQWVEATAFAWLAKQTLSSNPANAMEVTGAHQPVILGGIYPSNPNS